LQLTATEMPTPSDSPNPKKLQLQNPFLKVAPPTRMASTTAATTMATMATRTATAMTTTTTRTMSLVTTAAMMTTCDKDNDHNDYNCNDYDDYNKEKVVSTAAAEQELQYQWQQQNGVCRRKMDPQIFSNQPAISIYTMAVAVP